jgi:hypothetical protein
MGKPRTHPDNRSATGLWKKDDPDYQNFALFCDRINVSRGQGIKLIIHEYLDDKVQQRVEEVMEKYGPDSNKEAC